MYKINNIGQECYNKVKNKMLKSLLINPFTISLLLVLNYFAFHKQLIIFYTICCPTIILFYFIFGLYAPLRILKKQNNIINEFIIDVNYTRFSTFNVLWLNAKTIEIKSNLIKIQRSKFNWFGVEDKEGLTINIGENQKLFFVFEFFDDYDNIVNQLNTNLSIKSN